MATGMLLMLCLLPCLYGQSVKMIIKPQATVKPGTDVLMQCEIRDVVDTVTVLMGKDITTNLTKDFVKREHSVMKPISVNEAIIGPFKADPRYSIKREEIGNVVSYVLSIKDAKREDSGLLTCTISRGDKMMNESAYLEVLSEVDVVEFLDHDIDARVNFNESEWRNITCVTYGSTPPANVSVWAGDRNITHYFKRTVYRQLTTCDSTHNTQNCVEAYRYVVEMRNDTFRACPCMDREKLKCVAQNPVTKRERETGFYMVVYHRPVFRCSDDTLNVTLGAQRFLTIRCNVTANPAILFRDVKVEFRNGSRIQTITVDSPAAGYELSVKGLKDNFALVKLTILQLGKEHLDREYRFRAYNSLGKGNQETVIIKKAQGVSLGQQTSASIVAGLLLPLMTLLLSSSQL